MSTKQTEVSTTEILHINPANINPLANSRYGLKKTAIDSLAESILAEGRVLEPVEIEPAEDGKEGHYDLNFGFYRHAAVMKLNKEQGAGLTLPCILVPREDRVARLRRQLAENMARTDQSPMDKAQAMKAALDLGIPKVEIRNIFKAIGGRKGTQVQPASNSFINMTLSFLELPKAMQDKIHDGRIGVAAAYELTKVAPEKRAAVLERAEADRLKELEAADKDEEKYLAQERKAAEGKEKQEAAGKELEAAQTALKEANTLAEATAETAAAAYKAAKTGSKDDKEKAKKEQALKDAEAANKEAMKAVDAAGKAVLKLEGKVQTAQQFAADRAKKLKDAREANKGKTPAKKTAVGPQDVKKAAVKEGASTNFVPAKLKEFRDSVESMTLPGTAPKVMAINACYLKRLNGEYTDGQLYEALMACTGEKAAKAKAKA